MHLAIFIRALKGCHRLVSPEADADSACDIFIRGQQLGKKGQKEDFAKEETDVGLTNLKPDGRSTVGEDHQSICVRLIWLVFVSHYITDLRKGITLGKEDLYN